ncbi:MAG: bifunctional rhamnulose-1-phosphate aldolase/short-chain dehydrogenase [Rhodothermales bacterium]|nr:bifunctional rhamnulose-1-phosphate aldolase/short-chain dehydrogenase [Rhodothermales bacterium]
MQLTDESVKFKHVENLWDDSRVAEMDGVDRLVYRSNLLGTDWRITNTGGGNTSSKLSETDPLTGETVEVLWVKGSGGDLRTAKRENFSSLYQGRLVALQDVYARRDDKGLKSQAEDEMVAMYRHCTFNLNPRASSIDTPLHSFIPHPIVDHTHPTSCIAIATASNGQELTKEVYGDDVEWVDWMRPGFELGLEMQRICRENPNAKGIILGGHGLINWADDDKACYLLSLELIERAAEFIARRDRGDATFGGQKIKTLDAAARENVLVEILPWLRGKVSQEKRFIGTVETNDRILEFVNSHDASRLAEMGTSCPDHFLRTKIKPLFVDWDPHSEDVAALRSKLSDGLEQYQADYRAYYEEHKHPNSPAIRPASPTVVLIPGVGMITWGKTKSESRVTAEFYNAAVEVMRGAEAISDYTALPRQEAFDIEYWLLEEAKLKRQPPEKELARHIVAVVGAGSGIGREVVSRILPEGATVVALDVHDEAASKVAGEAMDKIGMGIGVAGSGISGSGDVIGLQIDITNPESVSTAIRQILLAYGGIDDVVVTAGYYPTPDASGNVSQEMWARTFAVNVTGSQNIAEAFSSIWDEQGLQGSLVLTTSVNAAVAKKGSLAYDTSKAAANHLIRELAIELAPGVRVNGLAPATVVGGSSMFPRDRVMSSLRKYSIEFDESESTEDLRAKLARFYASRTLTQRPISTADQAEAVFLLISDRLSKTTGQVLTVDGGLVEAFLR